MKRFFGKMPSSEVEVSKRYKDENGLEITIEAGPHGWTIIYADSSTNYVDEDKSSIENFNEALNIAKEKLGTLVELSNRSAIFIVEET